MIRKTVPLIVLLDILAILLFIFLAKPNKPTNLNFLVKYEDKIVDGVKIVTDDKKAYSYIAGELDLVESDKLLSTINLGQVCKPNSYCYKQIRSIIPHLPNKTFSIYFPDDLIQKAYSMRINFCEEYGCDGNIYFDASTGISYLCSSNKKFVFYNYLLNKTEAITNEAC